MARLGNVPANKTMTYFCCSVVVNLTLLEIDLSTMLVVCCVRATQGELVWCHFCLHHVQ